MILGIITYTVLPYPKFSTGVFPLVVASVNPPMFRKRFLQLRLFFLTMCAMLVGGLIFVDRTGPDMKYPH